MLDNLLLGFSVALTMQNILYVLAGVIVGMLFGAFPGLGAPTAIALLLPLTFSVDPASAIIMLAGIYYGTMYGSTITSVLINVPGESASVVTSWDGHAMARKGRAGQALTIAAVGSFVAGTIAIVLFMFLAPALAEFALDFGPAEYFALVAFALATIPILAGGARGKVLVSVLLGLLFATIGIDDFTGESRFTFGSAEFLDGFSFIPAVIGLFGIADVLYMARHPHTVTPASQQMLSLRAMWPSRSDWARVRMPIVRGSFLGFGVGVLPGAGATVASFLSYGLEKAVSKRPEEFGKGAPEGVAGPESANNSAAISAFIPTLTLGVPGSGTTAVLLGGFLIWGLTPGPQLFQDAPDFAWGLVASMYVGNAMLLILSILLLPIFAQALRTPASILGPMIVVFCTVGAVTVSGSMFDVWTMFFFGALGYLLRCLNVPTAPLVMALVLGPILESSLRQALSLSQGSLDIFVKSPIAVALGIATVLLFSLPLLRRRLSRDRTIRTH
ncbi:tripartite tricarboxylate transporter permease [Mycolicibacterium sp. XJ870]